MGRFHNPRALSPPVGSIGDHRPVVTPAHPAIRRSGSFPTTPAPRAPLSSGSAIDPAEYNALRKIGFLFALAFVATRFSLVSEILTFGIGFKPYLIILLGPAAIFCMLLSGGLARSLRSTAAWFMCLFMAWCVVVAPFSVWKGGTALVLKEAFQTEFSMFFMIAGLALTIKDVKRLAFAIGAGGFINVASASFYGGYQMEGRFSMRFGTLLNPNDYAAHLILTLPFLALYVVTGQSRLRRIIAAAGVVGGMLIVLFTGSRGAMLAIATMVVFIFSKLSMSRRAALMGAGAVLAVVAVLVLPPTVYMRYLLIFNSDSTRVEDPALKQEITATVGSTEARRELLKTGIALTLENPLFGVGPGQFAVSEADMAKLAGRRGHWLVSHNTYTEISSETGFPGLIFFSGAIIASLLALNRVFRQTRRSVGCEDLSVMAQCMMLSLVGFSVCIFFGSLGYRYYVPSLVGLTVAFTSAVRQRLQAPGGLAATDRPAVAVSARVPARFSPAR